MTGPDATTDTMRIAAIDVGTNSVHLLVADVAPDGSWSVVEKAREQVELGAQGLARNRIAPHSFDRGLAAMAQFQQAAESLGVAAIHCAATSAVREAENGQEWCRAVREETGIRVRAIAGREEGRLIYLGARADLDFSLGRVLLVDLGGGSTEFIVAGSEGPAHIQSLPLGHIRLTEAFHRDDPLSKSQFDAMKAHVKEQLKPLTAAVKRRDFHDMVGTSGTLRCLARLATAARGDELPEHDHGLVLHRDEIENLVRRFRQMRRSELLSLPGMDPRRQRTLIAGAVLVRQVMRAYDASRLVTSERSLRDGLVVDWIVRHRPEVDLLGKLPDPKARSIRWLMERYGADTRHAETVRDHALAIFDGLGPVHRMGFDEREMLQHAALVHDIGHHISGKNHNKHAQYLIRNTRMNGFTAPEVALLGNLVRYHRGGKPKTKHLDFAALSTLDRRRVRVLAGILRVADALDRSHEHPVTGISVDLGDGVVRIRAIAETDAHLERWAADSRKDLLASALRQEVRIEVRPRTVPSLDSDGSSQREPEAPT